MTSQLSCDVMGATRFAVRQWFVGALVVVLAAGAICDSAAKPKKITATQFAALSQREQHLAIYDAFCEQLEEHYYHPKLLKTDDWRARLREWREKAAAAPDALRLYMDVFDPLKQQFPHSHIDVISPQSSPSSTAATADRSDRLMTLMASGPGFDLVRLRRGAEWNTVVGDVVAGSPADKAGIEPGWSVQAWSIKTTNDTVHFDGEFLRLTPGQAHEFERRLSFTVEGLETSEQGQAFVAANTFKVNFDYAPLPPRPPLEAKQLPGGVTFLRFDSFADSALVDQVIAAIDGAGPAGLIVDLRRNPGGRNLELHRVLSRLLGNDAYIGTVRRGRRIFNLRTEKQGPHYSGPLAVLIGPLTGSAAEMLAAAVIDNKRGPVIGRMSNGSVLSSNYYPLPGGWQVFLPEMDYVRGGDRPIEGVGVEPDIRVMPTLEDVRAGRDPMVDRALIELRADPKAAHGA